MSEKISLDSSAVYYKMEAINFMDFGRKTGTAIQVRGSCFGR